MNLYVYRLIVESWPTPDGKPWARVYGPKYYEAEDVPDWLRGLVAAAHCPTSPEGWRIMKRVDEIPEDHSGDSLSIVMPKVSRRHYLSASGAHELARDMRAFGAVVRVERSKRVEWAHDGLP